MVFYRWTIGIDGFSNGFSIRDDGFSIRDDGFSMVFYCWTIGIDGFCTVEPLVSMVFPMVTYRGNTGLDVFSIVWRKPAMVINSSQKSANRKKT